MSCKIFKQSCQVKVQRFIKIDQAKSYSGLKLSKADGDWGVNLEQWLECQEYYFTYAADISNFQYRADLKMSLFEALHKQKTNLSHFQPFGVESWVYVSPEQWNSTKFDAWGFKIFKQSCKGHSERLNKELIWPEVEQCIFNIKYVYFDINVSWHWYWVPSISGMICNIVNFDIEKHLCLNIKEGLWYWRSPI